MEINKVNFAWAAGLFDGEGCTTISNRTRKNKIKVNTSGTIRLIIGMTEIEPLERFKNIFKLGRIRINNKATEKRKLCYRFEVCKFEDVQAILCCLWGYLSKFKQEQAKKCLLIAKSWKKYSGQDVYCSKLSEIEVKEIKKELLNYKHGLFAEIAKKYNVTGDCIALIYKGHTWKSVVESKNGK